MEDNVQTRRSWLGAVATGTAALSLSGYVDRERLAFAEPNEVKVYNVNVVNKAGYDRVIAANKGKVVVVDCWATWCVPCRKAFPKTVELSKAYASKGVVVVSLSFDDPVKGQAPDKVKDFLRKQDAQFDHLISSLSLSEDGADAFDIADGALPHFKIYSKSGKLFKKFESGEGKEFTHEDVEAAVKAALKAE